MKRTTEALFHRDTTLPEVQFRRWTLAVMVVVAFALRLGLIFILHTYRSEPNYQSDWFGAETGSIARSIALGHGFASPFGGDTGPSAWIGPVYPYLCAAVFKIFGVFGETSAQVILSLNSLFSALTCIPMYLIGARVFSRRVALGAGWTWAIVPIFMHWPTTWVWEISLSALLTTLMVLQALRTSENPEPRQWALQGVLIGFSALVNPALLTVAVVALMWSALRVRHHGWLLILRRGVLTAIIAGALITPWLVRNRAVFGQFTFIRSNFGFEFHLGNYHLSNGMGWAGRHPLHNAAVYAQYRSLGELEFVRVHGREAMQFVRQYPAEFLSLTAQRFIAFWDGTYILYDSRTIWKPWMYWPLSLMAAGGLVVAVWRRVSGALLIGLTVLLYPAPYYLTYPQHRYRHAVEPLLLILAFYLVLEVGRYVAKRAVKAVDSEAAQPSLAVGSREKA